MGMAFLHDIWGMLENTSVKYLDWPRFCSWIAEVGSGGLFSWFNKRSLIHGNSAFQCSYVFGHKTRNNNDQKFVKPILEMRDIDQVNYRVILGQFAKLWDSATYLSNKLAKITWITCPASILDGLHPVKTSCKDQFIHNPVVASQVHWKCTRKTFISFISRHYIFKAERWFLSWITISPENNTMIIQDVHFNNSVFRLVISFETVSSMSLISKMGLTNFWSLLFRVLWPKT